MSFRYKLAAITSAAVVTAGFACAAAEASSVSRVGPSPQALTWAAIYKMTPVQQGDLQAPLLDAGSPVVQLGQTSRWDRIYGGMAMDTPRHLVRLYVTSLVGGSRLLAAVKKADPRLRLSLIKVALTRYSVAQYNAAAARLLRASHRGLLPFHIDAVGMPVPARAIQVMVAHPQAAGRLAAERLATLHGDSVSMLAGVDLSYTAGTAPKPAVQVGRDIPQNRQDDSIPFIGGDGLSANVGSKTESCTAGIPVEGNGSNDTDYLVTAAHCFPKGTQVWTWDAKNFVGTVTQVDSSDDAELINTGYCCGKGSNADEGEYNKGTDGIQYYPLTGMASFMADEIIYQDGIQEFLRPNGPGGVQKLISQSTGNLQSWYINNVIVSGYSSTPYTQGTCTRSDPAECAIIGGDSGGVVFIYNGGNREALGMNDAGTGGSDCSGATIYCTTLYFTYGPNILAKTYTWLNPHT
jgi:hypothetical protein